MPLASWGGHIFEVSAKTIRSFQDLQYKAGCETEEKTAGTEKYEAKKAIDPVNVSFTANLRSYFGVDVRRETDAFLREAREGKKDYFYLAGEKLFGCMLMLKNAEVSDPVLGMDGFLKEAKCSLALVQCEKMGGGTGSGSGSGGGTGSGTGTGSGKKASVRKEKVTQDLTTGGGHTRLKIDPLEYAIKVGQQGKGSTGSTSVFTKAATTAVAIAKAAQDTKNAATKSWAKQTGTTSKGKLVPDK